MQTEMRSHEENVTHFIMSSQDISINLRDHLQQNTSRVRFRNSLDHDLRLINLTHI